MRVFKTPLFAKWAKKEKLTDRQLCNAVKEIEQGLVDADLGGHIYKKRIALQGRGKRGGGAVFLLIKLRKERFLYLDLLRMKKKQLTMTI